MVISRRGLMASSTAGIGIAVTGSFPSLAEARPRFAATPSGKHRPFPALVDDPEGIVALPSGFS